jgi:formylglycine-generating enzyme required for sulfatase activity
MPVMRILPRGSFLLGASFDDPDRAAYEMPQKRIEIPASFAMGVFPVLASEYVRITGSPVPALLAPEPERRWFDRFVASSPAARPAPALPPVAGIPLTCVSFDDAQAFVDRLSAASEQKYRVPSEAEWEFACRAGSTTRYSCGDWIDSSRAVFGQGSGPFPVGALPSNGFGLYDMHGNVREWAADLWHDNYDLTPQDGRPALDGHSSMRLVRGGGWRDTAVMLRSAARMRATQSLRNELIGFRVARAVN